MPNPENIPGVPAERPTAINPGIDPEINFGNLPPVAGPISPADFQRATLREGHQRLSPGDDARGRNTTSRAPRYPVRARDFNRSRTVNGSADTTAQADVREPQTPEDYWKNFRKLSSIEPALDRPALPDNSAGGEVDNKDTSLPLPMPPVRADRYGRADVIPTIAKQSEATRAWGPLDAWDKKVEEDESK